MTKDEIIPLAIKAGFEFVDSTNYYAAYPEEIQHFACLIKARYEDALIAAEQALDTYGLGSKTKNDALCIIRETLYEV